MIVFPRVIYRGDWDPTRHDAVSSRVVEDEAACAKALADGWRLDPTGATEDSDFADLNDPAALSEAPVVGQYPKRRGRPPKAAA